MGHRRLGDAVTNRRHRMRRSEGSTVFHSDKVWIDFAIYQGKHSYPQAISPLAGARLTEGVAFSDRCVGWAPSARRSADATDQ